MIKNCEIEPRDYLIREEMNRDSLGTTYKMQHISTNEKFCSYFFDEIFPNNPDHLIWTNVVRQILEHPHPNVIRYIGYSPNIFKGSQNPQILKEYVSFKKLSDYFSNPSNNFIETEKQIIIFGIISALRYLHYFNITHCELSPMNIYLNKDFEPIVDGFDSTFFINVSSSSQFLISRPFNDLYLPYYSPESFKDGVFNEKTDVYSFGMILYEILTDTRPYSELKDIENLRTLKVKVPNGYRPKIFKALSFQFQKMIEKCLDQDPDRRPTFERLAELLATERYILDNVDNEKYNAFRNKIKEIEVKYGILAFKRAKKYSDFGLDEIKTDENDEEEEEEEKEEEEEEEETDEEILNLSNIDESRISSSDLIIFHKVFDTKAQFLKVREKSLNKIDNVKEDDDKINLDDLEFAQNCFYIFQKLFKGTDGFPHSIDESIVFLKKAADLNLEKAVLKYANLLNKGTKIPRDRATAAHYYSKGVALGNTASMVKYGEYLESQINDNNDNNRDNNKYFDLNIIKISNNHTKNENIINNNISLNHNNIYNNNIENGKIDKERIKKEDVKLIDIIKDLYFKAMEKGNLDAQCHYAYLIENKDYERACELYIEAAEKGNKLGLYHYERTHEDPPFDTTLLLKYANILEDKKKDPKKAAEIYKKIANFGDPEGEVGYGRLLEKGIGISKSGKKKPELAAYHYSLAAKNGSSSGHYNYGRVLQNGIGIDKNLQLACHHYEIAAKLGDTNAMNCYGKMLEAGVVLNNNINHRNFSHEDNNKNTKININEEKLKSIDEAAIYYQKSADLGNAEGMFNIARIIELGCSSKFPKNLKESARYYLMAADNGNPDGMFNIARLYQDGIGVPKDLNRSFEYFKKASESGNVRAMNSTGFMLRHGFGTQRNDEKAMKYFKLGAKSGNPIAMNNYGEMLESGSGTVHKNMLKALKYFQISAESYQNASAMNNFGRYLENGFGIERNVEKAMEFYQKAGEQGGNSEAIYNYGRMLEEYKKDPIESVKHYEKAAKLKCPKAMKRYAEILEKGEFGVKQNLESCTLYFKLAADAGITDCMVKVAQIYEDGKYVKQDLRQCARYYKMSAENGMNSTTMFKYAELLETGKGIMKDLKEAVVYYKKAAELGDVKSMIKCAMMSEQIGNFKEAFNYYYVAATIHKDAFALFKYGELIEEGKGTEKNATMAVQLYKRAADMGNADAMFRYALKTSRGEEGVNKNYVVAYQYFKMASESGNIDATTKAGIALKNGIGVEKDLEAAKQMFKKSAEEGDPVAMLNYAQILETDSNIKEARLYFEKACQAKEVKGYYLYAAFLEKYFLSSKDENNLHDNDKSNTLKEILNYYKLSADNAENVVSMKKYASLLPIEEYLDEKIVYYKKACEKNDFESMFLLGKLFEYEKKNEKEALKYYEMASENNVKEAYSSYARLSEDLEIKKKYYQLSADDLNDNKAAYEYAKIMKKQNRRSTSERYLKKSADSLEVLSSIVQYAEYLDQESKIEESQKYYKIAADKGDLKSILLYGKYMESINNQTECLKYYKMAADKNDCEGLYLYGKILETMKKYESALILYEKSIEIKENPESYLGIGRLYENGLGVKRNYDDAFKFYEKSAKLNDSEAICNLGRMLEKGSVKLPNDNNQNTSLNEVIFNYYKQSAELGNEQGMIRFARCLLNGFDKFEKDEELALKYYKILSEQGNKKSMYFAGKILIKSKNKEDQKTAIQYFKQASDLGEIEAMLEFASLLKKGVKAVITNENGGNEHIYKEEIILAKNERLAAKIMKQSADRRNTIAMRKYSTILRKGEGIVRNEEESLKYLKLSADYGNERGMMKYVKYLRSNKRLDEALKYLNALLQKLPQTKSITKAQTNQTSIENNEDNHGINSTNVINLIAEITNEMENHSGAAKIFKQNADNSDNVEAMMSYAKMAENGTGIEKNVSEAAKYYKKAADFGNIEGMINYAKLSQIGYGSEMANESEIETNINNDNFQTNNNGKEFNLSYLKKFKEQTSESPITLVSLGRALSSGFFELGNSQELSEAANYFKKAADLGNSEGIYNYAKMCSKGVGIELNEKEALEYYLKGSEKNDFKAMRKAAKMLLDGNEKVGIQKDEKRSRELFQRAAIEGQDAYSLFKYAEILRNEGKNEESAKCFKLSAEKGIIEGDLEYGKMLEKGIGVERNIDSAISFYYLASEMDNAEASYHIGRLYERGIGKDKNFKEAYQFYIRASEKGNIKAMFRVGKMNEKGKGIPRSKQVAMKFYQQAADNGYVKAMIKFADMRKKGKSTTQNLNDSMTYYEKAMIKGSNRAKIEFQKIERIFKKKKSSLPPIPTKKNFK